MLLSGMRREGMFIAVLAMMWKLLRTPGEILPFVLMDYFGYD